MKKRTTKLLALVLTVICIAASFTIYSSAVVISESFSRGGWVYTDKTNTSGAYSLYLSGIVGDYFYYNSFIRGANIANFTTIMNMRFSNYVGYFREENFNSDVKGTHVFEETIRGDDTPVNIPHYAISFTEYRCTNKNDSQDYWLEWETFYWVRYKGWSVTTY